MAAIRGTLAEGRKPSGIASSPKHRRACALPLNIVLDAASIATSRVLLYVVAASLASQLATPTSAFAQAPEVTIEIGRDKIYEGESVRYRIFVNHIEKPAEPKLVGFDAFNVQPAGTQAVNSSSVTIIQGRRREIVRRGIVYDYILTPKQTGELQIPAPIVEVDGESLPTKSLKLSVVAAEDQDVVILEMTTSHASVYPMQPFEVALKVAVKPLPDPASDRDPLAVQNPLVQLAIPWADDEALADGVQAKTPTGRWLAAMSNRTGGFSINGRESSRSLFGGGFGGFFDDLPEGYRPTPKRVARSTANGRRMQYWEYTFTREFVATKIGNYQFGPATVKGTFGTRTNTRGELQGEPVYAFAKAVSVNVKDVPLDGRPDSYSGAVGRFDIGADISPQVAKVGDPMTLTLWLRGTGTLENALAPKLEEIDGFARLFKVYEATEETRGDSRVFTYSVRPKGVGTNEVPPVEMSYFNVDQEKFVTLRTDPISITVTEADRLADDEIAISGSTQSKSTSVETRADGIFANVTDLQQLRDETVHPDRWFFSLGGLTGLFFVVALVTQHWQKRQSDTSLQRRRGALAEARRRLQAAIAKLADGSLRDGAEAVSAALLGLVADVTDTPHGVLTTADAISKLRELEINDEVVAQVQRVMQSCDDARYGASGDTVQGLSESAKLAFDSLAQAMKGQRLLS